MKEIKKVLGKKIREAREEKGITQRELGLFLGYSPMGVSHFEKGIRELKISDVEKLSQFFNKSMSYFLQSESTFFRANSSDYDLVEKSLKDFDFFLEQKDL